MSGPPRSGPPRSGAAQVRVGAAVADAAAGVDERRPEPVELAPQVADVGLHDLGLAGVAPAPDALQELGPGSARCPGAAAGRPAAGIRSVTGPPAFPPGAPSTGTRRARGRRSAARAARRPRRARRSPGKSHELLPWRLRVRGRRPGEQGLRVYRVYGVRSAGAPAGNAGAPAKLASPATGRLDSPVRSPPRSG